MKRPVHSHLKKLCMMELETEPGHSSPSPYGQLLSCDSAMKQTQHSGSSPLEVAWEFTFNDPICYISF